MKVRPITYRKVEAVIVATEAATGQWTWGYKLDWHGIRHNDSPCPTDGEAFDKARSAAEKAIDVMFLRTALVQPLLR